VGVAATSHKAIHNLLDAVEEAAREAGVPFRGLKKASAGNDESFYRSTSIANAEEVADVVAFGGLLVAGTAWLFAHHAMDGALDTLVIDEAGQVSLADALAMGTSARNVILLGDPLQLAQVSQGTHPPGTGASVLEHLLGDAATIPPSRGVFLPKTRRMHPDVCRFVSEVVYAGRLFWEDLTASQTTAFGTGLRFVPVDHVGNQVASLEEAARVADLIAQMRGASWSGGVLTDDQFMVVAPYNAQVRRLRQALDAAGLRAVQAGTVDKFQGREAAVVFYSMATSSAEDVPRSLEFLFSRNRLNVAVSRARCLAYVVASPRLLESRARTVEQMRLVNALCRFVELAENRRA
jgi:superfamily I DNA and/or RNA helicase